MDEKTLRLIRDALQLFRQNVNQDMSLNQAIIFLETAMKDGITQPDLMQKLGIESGSVSGAIRRLALRKYKDAKGKIVWQGFGIVKSEQSLDERRKSAVYLTKKGRELAEQLSKLGKEE